MTQEKITDAELLTILSQQREDSVGFDNDKVIAEERARALDYYKAEYSGYVQEDLPAGNNRSNFVSSDVADDIEKALPDLIEVFTSGDDAVTFRAVGEEDEGQARQETDYVRHVVFGENDGFMLFYTSFKDALLSKLGVWHYYWDSTPEYTEYDTEVWEDELVQLKEQGIEIVEYDEIETSEEGLVRYRVLAQKILREGRVRIESVAPEDFTVAPNTVRLRDTDYCAMRSRVSVQSLLKDGYKADLVGQLRDVDLDDSELQQRDLNGENDNQHSGVASGLELVEVVVHYIRLDVDGDGDPQIWRIVTGNDEMIVLDKERRPQIEFSAITPFPMPHRLIGQSLADKTIGIQRWKSVLTRMMNDSGMYATSQRQEVSQKEIVDGITLQQLVNNQPGAPVVTKTGAGLRPIQTAAPSFDMLAAIEHANTVKEERTGVVRNAQGLNPDTLHDTKGGAEILIAAAQKRTRMMARLFAEGGIKDLFLGVHELLRSNATMSATMRLRGRWEQVSPSSWQRRKDMEVDIGVGSGGRENDIAVLSRAGAYIDGLIAKQGGVPDGPFISRENIHAFSSRYLDRLGIKAPERYLRSPDEQQDEQKPQQPSPDMMKAQADIERGNAELQMKAQTSQAKAQADLQNQEAKLAFDMEVQKMRLENEMTLAREKAQAEVVLARERMEMEFRLQQEKIILNARNGRIDAATVINDGDDDGLTRNRPGGDLSQ